jgi:hypothetical protein
MSQETAIWPAPPTTPEGYRPRAWEAIIDLDPCLSRSEHESPCGEHAGRPVDASSRPTIELADCELLLAGFHFLVLPL